jgi:hypothetical protein
MTDIVERLRKLATTANGVPIFADAADVIERLRADLAQRDHELSSILLQIEADLSSVDKT